MVVSDMLHVIAGNKNFKLEQYGIRGIAKECLPHTLAIDNNLFH